MKDFVYADFVYDLHMFCNSAKKIKYRMTHDVTDDDVIEYYIWQ